MRQNVALALLLAVSLKAFGQVDNEPSPQQSIDPSGAERLLDDIAPLFLVDSLTVAALERDERLKFELLSYGNWFIPYLEHSTTYAVARAFHGLDLRWASLTFRARFASSQSLDVRLYLPLEKRPESCLTEALVRNRFGVEQSRSRSPHGSTSLSYKAARVTVSFTFNGGCASAIHVSEATRSAQSANNLRQYSAPSSQRASGATISELLGKLVTLQSLSPEAVRAHLQTRVALSSTVEWFGILQRRETHYQMLDVFDDKFQGTAGLSLKTPRSSPAIQDASLGISIARPLMNCVEPTDLTTLGAVLEQTIYNDDRPYKQTFRTPAGFMVELTYARGCVWTVVMTHQMVRK